MSVRPDFFPSSPALSGAEGELVSVHVYSEPRRLERLLECLAELSFPVNPQLYHQAGISYVYPDGGEESRQGTIVEFPAFSEKLDEIRKVMKAANLSADHLYVRGMLEDIHSDSHSVAAPNGFPYCRVKYYKHLPNA